RESAWQQERERRTDICAKDVQNASDENCNRCCLARPTQYPPSTWPKGFDAQKHVMDHGALKNGECYCWWNSKKYETRNQSDKACDNYCMSPEALEHEKFDPTKMRIHFGELRRGKCACRLIDRDINICDVKLQNSSDEACNKCCTAPGTTSKGVDPEKQELIGGHLVNKGTKYQGCHCDWKWRPGFEPAPEPTPAPTPTSSYTPSSTYTPSSYTGPERDTSSGYRTQQRSDNPCDDSNALESDYACTACCMSTYVNLDYFDSFYDRMNYGKVTKNGTTCTCYYTTNYYNKRDSDYTPPVQQRPQPEPEKWEPCDHKDESVGNCFACCEDPNYPPSGFDPSTQVISNASIEGGRCVCYWKNKWTREQVENKINSMIPW
ncbi:MAG: hypothetical protein J5601_01175, partial [Elusimicrobiaceae bacterium]|nr:hypothetical protein [Elusimicrobiaceae bacterium]